MNKWLQSQKGGTQKFSTIPIVHTKTKDLMEKVQKRNKEPEKKNTVKH